MASSLVGEPLSFWEKADLFAGQLSVLGAVLYSAVTGAFRGKSGTKQYNLHIIHAAVRKTVSRLSVRQLQTQNPSTTQAYEAYAKSRGLQPQTVTLKHGAKAHWIGNKDAKNVVVYYHGGGFALPANAGHFTFYSRLIEDLNKNGHEVALFFLEYTLTPPAEYPTQLRQSVEALRYILTEAHRDPSNVIVGGDSAGGNLALAVLLHLTHPHPEIEPLDANLAPLAGVFGFAPWVSFSLDGASILENKYKDIIPSEGLKVWSKNYIGNRKQGDEWSEPARAPAERWQDAKAQQILILAGRDEILFTEIEKFANRLKTVVPRTTYIVGYDETHVSPVYSGSVETQQGRGLQNWIGARL